MAKITLDNLREANIARCVEWMGAYPKAKDITFHACELGGEVGEALNICKKFDRFRQGIPGAITQAEAKLLLKDELADVLICVDIIASIFDIDLAMAVEHKFNETSHKHNFETLLLPKKFTPAVETLPDPDKLIHDPKDND